MKYCQIKDPETCPIEELEKEVNRLYNLTEFYEAKQLAIKLFINSVYGACASKFFVGYNIDVAEAITLQGQHLNHFSENALNAYFQGIFQNDEKLHKELGIDHELAKKIDLDKGRISQQGPLVGPDFEYLKGNISGCVAGDTDSFSKNTNIITNKKEYKIDELFNEALKKNKIKILNNNSEIIKVDNLKTQTLNIENNQIEFMPINYIIRHKVNKSKFIIKTKSGKKIEITGDHSIMIYRNGEIISIKTKDINKKTDKLITIN